MNWFFLFTAYLQIIEECSKQGLQRFSVRHMHSSCSMYWVQNQQSVSYIDILLRQLGMKHSFGENGCLESSMKPFTKVIILKKLNDFLCQSLK